jgi:hypothetical protein
MTEMDRAERGSQRQRSDRLPCTTKTSDYNEVGRRRSFEVVRRLLGTVLATRKALAVKLLWSFGQDRQEETWAKEHLGRMGDPRAKTRSGSGFSPNSGITGYSDVGRLLVLAIFVLAIFNENPMLNRTAQPSFPFPVARIPLTPSLSFAVPFEEDDKDPKTWFLDLDYIESMWEMFRKVNGKSAPLRPGCI